MKILLLNDNPVITKLVTLSTQKLGFDLEQFDDVQTVSQGSYDLVIVDDQLYDDTLFSELDEKIEYKRTLCIHKKGEETPKSFDYSLSKPFLPTELVDILADVQSAIEEGSDVKEEEPLLDSEVLPEDIEDPFLDEEEKESSELDEFDLGEDVDLEDDLGGELETDLDEALEADLDEEMLEQNDDTLEIDDALDIDGGILDEEDLKEVQDLLEDEKEQNDIESENITLEDLDEVEIEEPSSETAPVVEAQESEVDTEIDGSNLLEDELDLDLDEDETEGLDSIMHADSDVENEDDETDRNDLEPEESIDSNEEEEEENFDIDEPVGEERLDDIEEMFESEDDLQMSQEEEEDEKALQKETSGGKALLDEEIARLEASLDETQLQTPIEDIDEELAALDETALKEALGEVDLSEDMLERAEDSQESEASEEEQAEQTQTQEEEPNAAVTTLKKLLQALEDKEIAASLKDRKIQITITIGGE